MVEVCRRCYKNMKKSEVLPYCDKCDAFLETVNALEFKNKANFNSDYYHVQKALEEEEISVTEYFSLRSKLLSKHKIESDIIKTSKIVDSKTFRDSKIVEFKKLS